MCEHEWVTVYTARELRELDPSVLAWAWGDVKTAGPWRACPRCGTVEDQ